MITQLAPLRNFPKAHSHPGVVTEACSPGSSHSDRRSTEVRRNVDYRCSADGYCQSRPPISLLPPSSQRGPLPFTPHNTAWSPATQIALSAQRGSTDMGGSAQTREQQIAKAAGSSFFAPTVAKPAAGNTYKSPSAANPSAYQAPVAPAASGLSRTALELPHAAAAAAVPAPAHCISRQLGENATAGSSSVFRNNAPLHGRTPSAALAVAGAAKPQYTRATRGSFDQPQTRPRGSCDLPQSRGRSSFEERADRGSFEQAYPRGRTSFDQLRPSSRGSMDQPPQLRSSCEQNYPGGQFSFEESQSSLRSSIDQLHAAGKDNVAQLQAAARCSFEQLQVRALASHTMLGAIPEQGIPNQPPMQDVHSFNSFTRLTQVPGAGSTMPQYPFGQFVGAAPSSNRPYSLVRASCDYPQPVTGSRVSADFPRAHGLSTAQLDRAASSEAPVSRHSLISSQEFARLDEPTEMRAAAAALGVTNLPPNQFWPEQTSQASLLANAAGSPFAQMDAQSYQPHTLQLHALNTLNALNRSAQPSHSHPTLWSQKQVSEPNQAGHGRFAATSASFPQTPSATSLGIVPSTPFPNWTPSQSHHSRPKHSESPANSILTEAGVNASDLQGTWGAHLDASAPNPSKAGSARGQSYSNPFLHPRSTFSIREAKLQLQNPTPKDFPEGLPLLQLNTHPALHDSMMPPAA